MGGFERCRWRVANAVGYIHMYDGGSGSASLGGGAVACAGLRVTADVARGVVTSLADDELGLAHVW